MTLTHRDSQTLASLLPEEIAVAFLMLRIAFPATYITGDGGGLLDYIGRRWLTNAVMQ
jgi:hypothetical protein